MPAGLEDFIFKKALDDYLNGKSLEEVKLKYKFKMKRQDFKTWLEKYKLHGEKCFNHHSNKRYSAEFKLKVVNEYLSTEISLRQLLIKYNISSIVVIRRWVNKHLLGEKLKDYYPKPEVYNMTNKSVKIEDKIQAIQYFLSDDDITYSDTAEKYNFSYSQVYRWVKIFNEKGYEGLEDHRGEKVYGQSKNRKTDIEKLNEEIYWLKLENESLKKQMHIREDVKKAQRKK